MPSSDIIPAAPIIDSERLVSLSLVMAGKENPNSSEEALVDTTTMIQSETMKGMSNLGVKPNLDTPCIENFDKFQPLMLHETLIDDHHAGFRCLKKKPPRQLQGSEPLLDSDLEFRTSLSRQELSAQLNDFLDYLSKLEVSTLEDVDDVEDLAPARSKKTKQKKGTVHSYSYDGCKTVGKTIH
ncbi:hypothetical protein ACH5RR_037128 [Cinchona calisaya]|uniref:Uncharacterized protein n=1 Tax=Cinchona calisaya TaxID=153742 RepID=A0ABD2Y586_9GENT